jgi:DMSO reductase family type II enzyme chaperone
MRDKMEQSPAGQVGEATQVRLARQLVYRFFAFALSDPRSRRWGRLREPTFLAAVTAAAELLRSAALQLPRALAPGETSAERFDLWAVVRRVGDVNFDVEGDYKSVFGLMMSKKHPPYESEYCPQTFSVYRAQVIADVAGFYRAFGLEPSRDMPERYDHVALELEFMAWLVAKQRHALDAGTDAQVRQNADICDAAARRFFQQHVAWWVPAFAHALRRRTSGFYRDLADALAGFVHIERVLLGVPAPTELVAPQQTQDTAECEQCCASEVAGPL